MALQPAHAFGLNAAVKDNIHYQDEQLVIYVAGHNVVLHNLDQRTQRLIAGEAGSDGITALAVSPRKDLLAVAEGGEKPTVSVYDLKTLKKKKTLSTAEVSSRTIVHLCFSPDSKWLLTLGGSPDFELVLWTWEKAKVAASVKASQPSGEPLYQCSFSPAESDKGVVCVSGHRILRFFRFLDSAFKAMTNPMGKREPQNYLCHAWVSDDRCIVGTDSGELLLVENFECKPHPLPQSPMDGNSINAIVPHQKGFICAGDAGKIHIFERADDHENAREREYYRRIGGFQAADGSKVLGMSVSPSEEYMICTTSTNQALLVPLSAAELKAEGEGSSPLSPATDLSHSAAIVGLDTCVRKPLVATCSTDCTVRVWNYADRSVDLCKTFPEECYTVSFHPSGLHVLVGFSDKLRLMNLLMDDIRVVKEIPIKACRECQFSHGGQYFAAVYASTIQIFDTYSCENVANLRGHNGKVRSISWSPDDAILVSAGIDGAVYEWRTKGFKRDVEHDSVQKECQYTSVVCNNDARAIFAVGTDRKLKEITNGGVTKEFTSEGSGLTQVCLSNTGRMLFAGTDTGAIRSYTFPLSGEFQSYECHSGAVNKMCMSHNDDFLFSVGDDACLYIFDVKDKEGRAASEQDALPPAEEVLITKSDLEETNNNMQELKTKVEELTMQNEYQMRLKELNYQDKLKELTDKYTAELDEQNTRYELVLNEKNDMEMDYEEKMKASDETYEHSRQQFEAQYQEKIMLEVERYRALQQEKELMNERWDVQNSLLVDSHKHVVRQMTEDYEQKLATLGDSVEQARDDREDLIRQFDESKTQIEQDADRELEELKEKFESKLNAEREIALRLKGENTMMRKKQAQQQRDIDEHKDSIREMYRDKEELYAKIRLYEKDVRGQKQEIKERDETIGDKEKRIFDLKRKNQELEKFKFVLDYKIKELKRQIEPRQVQIAMMKEQINKMDQELERYHSNNSNLELTISDQRLKLEGVQAAMVQQRTRAQDAEAQNSKFKKEVHEVVQHIQNPKMLKEGVKALYHKYTPTSEGGTGEQADTDVASEYARQRDYLEKTVNGLKRKLQRDTEMHRKESMRVMQENVTLIREINDLRREQKAIKAAAKADTGGGGGGGGGKDGREIEMQRQQIAQLRAQLGEMDGRPASQMSSRPGSRERLPPMDYEGLGAPPPQEQFA